MTGWAWVGGDIMPLADATVPLDDRGLLVGDGVFETMRTTSTGIFDGVAHRARLQRGLDALGIDVDDTTIDDALASLVETGRTSWGAPSTIRLQITAGPMDDVAGTTLHGRVTGIVRPLIPYPESRYAGIHIGAAAQRIWSSGPLAGIKTLSFLPYVLAKRHATAQGLADAYLVNEHGRVVEGTTSNVFARHGSVVTAPGPDSGAVAGVTRDWVIERLEGVQEELTVDALHAADEVWLTNTTGGIVPVTRVDDHIIGDGAPGQMSRDLQVAYAEAVA